MRPLVTLGVGLFFFFAGSSGEGEALRFLEAPFFASGVLRQLDYKVEEGREAWRVSPSSSALPLTPFLPPERINAQFSTAGDEEIGWASHSYTYYTPACSTIKLLKTGFPQSLHLTSPMSEVDVSGRAP